MKTPLKGKLLITALAAIVIALGVSSFCHAAAPESNIAYSGGFADGTVTYIFVDTVNVRSAPDTIESNIVDKLGIGRKVTVRGASGSATVIDALPQKWYKVEYESDGKKKTGHIWGGFLAFAFVEDCLGKKGDLLLFGVRAKKVSLKGECRLVSSGKLVSSSEFFSDAFVFNGKEPYEYNVSIAADAPRGLENVSGLFKVNSIYEACGYPGATAWFALTKDSGLAYLGQETRVSEAGVFRSEKTFTFPGDKGGEPGKILVRSTSAEFDEKKKDYSVKEDKTEKWSWNGKVVQK